MNKLSPLFFCYIALLITACDGKSARTLCQENPSYCKDLNKDKECKLQKNEVIQSRYRYDLSPKDYQNYKLLIALEDYKQCMVRATRFPDKNPAIRQTRLEGYLTSLKAVRLLEEQTFNSEHPHLLYYHWSRHNNSKARDKFLAMKDSKRLNFPELQVGLAAHYIKSDLFEAVMALYKALQFSRDGIEKVDTQIYQTLTGIFLEEEELDKAYIWAYISAQTKKYRKEQLPLKVDLKKVAEMTKEKGLNIEKLQQVAELYMEEIDDGEFLPPV